MYNIQNYGHNKMNNYYKCLYCTFFLFTLTLVVVFVGVNFMAAVEDDLVRPTELGVLHPPSVWSTRTWCVMSSNCFMPFNTNCPGKALVFCSAVVSL